MSTAIRVSHAAHKNSNHSNVIGYQSWRRLGDVISSIFALGYHEQVGGNQSVPPFLEDLRQAAVESAYSADKNVSIFLGRPPRLLRRYCRSCFSTGELHSFEDKSLPKRDLQWMTQKPYLYKTEIYWSFRCAFFKEQVLELLQIKDHEERQKQAQSVKTNGDMAHY